MNNVLPSLEQEAIKIIREAFAKTKNQVLLFSCGKDSITLLHLAFKAFYPLPIPFSLLHIDTGHNFPEVIEFRDSLVQKYNLNLIVKKVEDTIKNNNIVEAGGKIPSRNRLQSITLLEAIKELNIDCCFGGARRDEDKARAKERIFSIRDKDGVWQAENQNPEVWDLYNGNLKQNENLRVFPLSNWTEIDIWQYINVCNIEIPNIYFSHNREVLVWNDKYIATNEFIKLDSTDLVIKRNIRYRTVGDMTCTAAIASEATTIKEIIKELKSSNFSERGETRLDDSLSETAMEDRKKQGYF